MTRSIGDNVFVPMAMIRGSADDAEEGHGGCRLACGLAFGGVLVCHEKIVLCFPLLVKSFCTRILFKFGIRTLVVSGCSSLGRV